MCIADSFPSPPKISTVPSIHTHLLPLHSHRRRTRLFSVVRPVHPPLTPHSSHHQGLHQKLLTLISGSTLYSASPAPPPHPRLRRPHLLQPHPSKIRTDIYSTFDMAILHMDQHVLLSTSSTPSLTPSSAFPLPEAVFRLHQLRNRLANKTRNRKINWWPEPAELQLEMSPY